MLTPQRTPQLIILAKAPVPGEVKTRLQTRYTPAEAAMLARASLEDTLAAAAGTGAPLHLVAAGDLAKLPPLPRGTRVHTQRPGDLDARISGAFVDAGGGVLIGMDTPQVTTQMLKAALESYQAGRTPYGLSEDGGWWILGLSTKEAHLVEGVPTSLPTTGSDQWGRLNDAGCSIDVQARLQDVDTPEEADEVADLAPGTRFASTHATLGVLA